MSLLLSVLLPLVTWLGLFAFCGELAARRRINAAPAMAWVLSSIGWAMILTVIIEGSSALHRLTPPTLAAAWMVSGAATVAAWAWLAARRGALQRTFDAAAWRTRLAAVETWPADARFLTFAAALLILTTGLLAAGTSSTNYDSMTYHLSRVAHWVAEGSVAHFPTENWREIDFGPWAEFGMANFVILGGNDRLVNLVQWFSMLTTVVAAVLVTQQVGPGWSSPPPEAGAADACRHQALRYVAPALAALMVAAMPMGIAQSMTTQNDYALACWFVCAVCMCLALKRDPTNRWYALGLGGALAVGFLTKSTMALFAAPFVSVLILGVIVRTAGDLLASRLILTLMVTGAAINGPHLWRNYSLHGEPLGTPGAMTLLSNDAITVSGTASNVIRNLSLYTATGVTPITRRVNALIMLAHRATGRDPNDQGLTFIYTPFALQDKLVVSDSVANSAYHLLMILAALALLSLRRVPAKAELVGLTVLVGSTFVLFGASIRWQPWHSRFHIGMFVLMMPVVAIVFVSTLPRRVVTTLGWGLLMFGTFSLMANETRPLRPGAGFLRQSREQQYFLAQPNAYTAYRDLSQSVADSRCRKVGLHLGFDDWEYPYWALLRNRGFDGRLYHVGVRSASATLAHTPEPCAVITTSPAPPAELTRALPYRTTYAGLSVWWAADVRPRDAILVPR